MITFITGIPGSGKTAKAVDHIIKHKDDDKYLYIHCNINQFDFTKVPKSIELDWDSVYQGLTELHTLYKSKANDEELIEYAKQYKLFNVLIVLDECHNYLDKKDPVLIWWLSYHRHLNQDIYLITQNLALVESKYKNFCEVFYKASPSFLRMRHHVLKYSKYIGSRMYKSEKFGVEKLDTKKNNVFSYYKSGNDSKGQNIIFKFIMIALGFLFIGALFWYLFLKPDFKSNEPKKQISPAPKIQPMQNNIQQNEQIYIPKEETFKNNMPSLIQFKCINKLCKVDKQVFHIDYINKLIELTQSDVIFTTYSKYGLVTGSFIASTELQNYFQRVSNEEDFTNSDNGDNNAFIR